MIFVPILLATGFLFGTSTPSLPTHDLLTSLSLPLNLCTLAALTYSTLYVVLSPNFAGLSTVPILLTTASYANQLATRHGSFALKVGLAVHVFSWIVQFIGHGKFEGRKPALLDNLVQALFLAPLFVWYEGLFGLGMYRGLREEVSRGVKEEVRRIREREGKGK